MRTPADQFGTHASPEGDRDLQEWFFRGLCLLGGAIGVFIVIPITAFQNLPAIVGIGAFGFGVFQLGLYWAARHGRYFTKALFIGLLVTLNVGWFPNAGSEGSIVFYFFPAVMYPFAFFRGITRWSAVGLVVANYFALMFIERATPGLATPFQHPFDRTLDLATGFITCAVVSAALMWIVVTGYTRERERLKVAAGALLQSEDQRTRLFQMNPDAIFLIDAETRRYLDVNEAFEHLSGWSKADVVGHTSVEFNLWVDPADRGRLYEELNARGEVRDFLCRFRRRDGSEFWGSTSVGWADIGGRRCLLLATRDVSEQLSAEKAVAESRALLSALIDSTDDFIFLVDPRTFGLTVFNDTFAKAAKDTLGVDVRPGMRMQDLLPPDIAAEWCGFYTRALAAGLFSLEYTVPGTSRILLLSLSPVRHGDEVIGVSVFGKDITNRKRAAEERERIEVQLLQAQKMESLGSLAGGVAHDFNNMLAGIMGYADLLLDDEHDSVQRERLQAILNAARRSSELTKKLLAFGRRGRNIVEPVELNAIVTDGLAMLRPSFTSSIAVVLELHGSWTVDGDPSQMNQMVLNLCINASEAMPAGGRLTIRTRDAELDAPCGHALHLKPGAYVELAIADTGAGMAGEVKERIFEPFFTTKVGGGVTGTGLGLSTVYGIVQLHQGAIAVDSTPGAGTTFTIYLPKGILRDVHLGAARPTPAGRGLILVVEDEELLRSFTAAALDRLGYSAIMAADGEEAVRVFRDRHAELTGVLLDLKMPKMGGRATFLEMADIDPRVPVLICSGYGDNEEAQGLITLGAKGLLPKPYRLADLSEQLAKLAP